MLCFPQIHVEWLCMHVLMTLLCPHQTLKLLLQFCMRNGLGFYKAKLPPLLSSAFKRAHAKVLPSLVEGGGK